MATTLLSRDHDLITRGHDIVSRAHEINKNTHMSPLCHRSLLPWSGVKKSNNTITKNYLTCQNDLTMAEYLLFKNAIFIELVTKQARFLSLIFSWTRDSLIWLSNPLLQSFIVIIKKHINVSQINLNYVFKSRKKANPLLNNW
jgi:hypothetical protein